MKILGIETSCDETSVGIIEITKTEEKKEKEKKKKLNLLGACTHSQISVHREFGGVVPEVAAREHFISIDKVISEALLKASLKINDIDRIAVVNGPGLVSSLLIGITAGKFLAWMTEKELAFVNHLKAHICAININKEICQPPFVCLLASGGHTQLLFVKNYKDIELLGETLDDSAGEAFDKVARMLELNYPGGPEIEKLAKSAMTENGNQDKFIFTRPKVNEFDFSFSGLKTAVLRATEKEKKTGNFNFQTKAQIAKAFQDLVVEELSEKLINAGEQKDCRKFVIAGGVSANELLRKILKEKIETRMQGKAEFFAPELKYCSDNGPMVAAAGYLCPDGLGLDFEVYSRA